MVRARRQVDGLKQLAREVFDEGTEVEEGKKILAESGTAIITANGLTDAAQKVVAASKA